MTKVGNVAIAFSIFADLSAGVPTLVKSWKYPETESPVEFASSFINVTIALFTVRVFSFAHVAFPLYIFLYNLAAVILITTRIGKRLADTAAGK